jgi:uncharacterized protein
VTERLLVWRGSDAWRAEAAHVRLGEGKLSARGTQIGADPEPYVLAYRLETRADYVTERLDATARGDGWERRLDLLREADGSWTANGEPVPEVRDALDCDLGLCPLTNTMPVLREDLLRGDAGKDFLMAWISVPDLGVHASEQRYEPVDARTVRYVGKHRDFVGELEFDEDGFVVRYPDLAERV